MSHYRSCYEYDEKHGRDEKPRKMDPEVLAILEIMLGLKKSKTLKTRSKASTKKKLKKTKKSR